MATNNEYNEERKEFEIKIRCDICNIWIVNNFLHSVGDEDGCFRRNLVDHCDKCFKIEEPKRIKEWKNKSKSTNFIKGKQNKPLLSSKERTKQTNTVSMNSDGMVISNSDETIIMNDDGMTITSNLDNQKNNNNQNISKPSKTDKPFIDKKNNWWNSKEGTFWIGVFIVAIVLIIILIYPIMEIFTAWLVNKKQLTKYKRSGSIEKEWN